MKIKNLREAFHLPNASADLQVVGSKEEHEIRDCKSAPATGNKFIST